jgi:hypothetical protein
MPLSQQIELNIVIYFSFRSFFVYTYNFVCMDDVINEAESALCNINKYHLQLKIRVIEHVIVFISLFLKLYTLEPDER